MIRKSLPLFLMAFFAIFFGGCANHPVRLNVTIEMDDDMRAQLINDNGGRRIAVDIVGLNANQAATWSKYSMTDYWQSLNSLRNSVPTFTMTFDPNDPKSLKQTFSKTDPIWDKWQVNTDPITDKPDKQDMPRLFVLAQIPPLPPAKQWVPATDDKSGNDDPRRQILPLGDNRWKSGGGFTSSVATDVVLKIQKNGLVTVTSFVHDAGQ